MVEPREITERFRLERVVKSSRSGIVFRAIDPKDGETVVIKLITPGGPGDQRAGLERFSQAVQHLQRLRCPSFPLLLDWGWTPDASAFMVMERLEGARLDTITDPSPDRLLRLLLGAADGLEALAKSGVAHGNLSPDNIFVVPDGDGEHAALLGFGTTAFRWPGMAPVRWALESSSADFMAPEWNAALAGQMPDWRSDLYAFGQIACQVLKADLVDVGDGDPTVSLPPLVEGALADPDTLTAVLAQALRRQPTARPRSWEVVRRAIEAALGGPERADVSPYRTKPVRLEPPAPDPGDDLGRTKVLSPERIAALASAAQEGELAVEAAPAPDVDFDTKPGVEIAPAGPAPVENQADTAAIDLADAGIAGAGDEPREGTPDGGHPDPSGGPPPPPRPPAEGVAPTATPDSPVAAAEPALPASAPAPDAAAPPLPETAPAGEIPGTEAAAQWPSPQRPEPHPPAADPEVAPAQAATPEPPAAQPEAQAPPPEQPHERTNVVSPAAVAAARPKPPAAPPARRRPWWPWALAAALVVAALGVAGVWFYQQQEALAERTRRAARPTPRPPTPRPTTAPAAPPVALTALQQAEEALATGDLKAVKLAIEAFTPETRAQLGGEDAQRLRDLENGYTLARRDQTLKNLRRGLATGDVRLLRDTLGGANRDDLADLTRDADAAQAVEEARRAVNVFALVQRAASAANHAEALQQAQTLLGILPRSPQATDARERAAAGIEAEADSALRAGQFDTAASRLEVIRRAWPDRPGLAARVERVGNEREADARVERALQTAARNESERVPEKGLEALRSVTPTARTRQAYDETRGRLERQLAELDANPPRVDLKAGAKLQYDKNKVATVTVRASDDHAVKDVTFFVRTEGETAYQAVNATRGPAGEWSVELAPALHQNKTVEFYVVASDLSGHTGTLGAPDKPIALKRKKWLF